MNTSLPDIQKRYNVIHALSALGPDDSDAAAISSWYRLESGWYHRDVGFLLPRCERLEAVLREVQRHLEELADAWQRGTIQECDGRGGTRSNRNADVAGDVRAALELEPR